MRLILALTTLFISSAFASPVVLDMNRFTAADDVLALRVGETLVSLRADRVRRRTDGVSVTGQVVEGGSFALSVAGSHLCGGIWTGEGSFEVRSVAPVEHGTATCEVRKVDSSVRCLGASGERPRPVIPTDSGASAVPAGSFVARGSPCECSDDESFVDVLVVYTTLAKNAAGGIGPLQASVQNVIDTTNVVFGNSGINDLQMNLVGFREVVYDEVSPAWLDHLVRVTETTDGIMDEVHGWRDTDRADCVMLIVDDARFTGGAAWWAIWDDGQAFSILNWRSAGGGNLTGAHEFGHNFGCAHDHDTDASAPFSYTWGHHYMEGANHWGTIMSYNGVTLPFFSTPQLTGPGGQPLGVPLGQMRSAYNALIIDQTRSVLANYRSSGNPPDCNNNGTDDASDIAGGSSTDLNNNGIPDECEATIRVDAESANEGSGHTWADAQSDLGEVVGVASLKCSRVREVWVANGTYLPDSETVDPWRRFSLRCGLELYGGFQGQSHPGGGELVRSERDPAMNPTILSGDIGTPGDTADNSYSVVDALFTDATPVLDGFTIRGGNSFGAAGGLFIDSGSPTVRSCIFEDNAAAGSGAGVAMYNGSAPVFEGCTFRDNISVFNAGGVGVFAASDATFTDCMFEDNHSEFGGAVAVYTQSSADLDACQFTSNSATTGAGAIDCHDGSSLTLLRCGFMGNEAIASSAGAVAVGLSSSLDAAFCSFVDNGCCAVGGALSSNDSVVRIDSSTFSGNTADDYGGAIDLFETEAVLASVVLAGNTSGIDGGAVSLSDTDLDVIGCTVHGNHADNLGGGIGLGASLVDVSGTIMWGNTAGSGTVQEQQIFAYSGVLGVDHSCVEGLDGALGGLGNTGSDPSFVNAAAGDLSLHASSPCIDASDNSVVPPDVQDLDGDGDTTERIPLDAGGLERFVDDPATADTGVGPAPIADMGAHEFQGVPCGADWNSDGIVNTSDFLAYLNDYNSVRGGGSPVFADPDLAVPFGVVNTSDFLAFLNVFNAGCP